MTDGTRYDLSLRRTRIHSALRDVLADVSVTAEDLMYPCFIVPGNGQKSPIVSMPGIHQQSIDVLVDELKSLAQLGLRAVILFGVIPAEDKDAVGSHILNEDSLIGKAVKAIKTELPDLLVAADVCFCEYTDHGHCGVLDESSGVANHQTVLNLQKQAIALARSGVDLLAPSGMMDGAVRAIRDALNEAAFDYLPIMGYSVKYASSFYGPFRDAAESAPCHGDRRQYQQDIRRSHREAMREALNDELEGADILMVKPGMPYLDIVSRLHKASDLPIAVYQVSGEYAMWKAASEKGWIDEERTLRESLYAFKRAGADIILTYAAPIALRLMANENGRLRLA